MSFFIRKTLTFEIKGLLKNIGVLTGFENKKKSSEKKKCFNTFLRHYNS